MRVDQFTAYLQTRKVESATENPVQEGLPSSFSIICFPADVFGLFSINVVSFSLNLGLRFSDSQAIRSQTADVIESGELCFSIRHSYSLVGKK
jgi:hypothetical protein